MKLKILPIIGVLLLSSLALSAQEQPPSSEEQLTKEDVEVIRERVFKEPNFDGAIAEQKSVDLSRIGDWQLRLRFQGRQNSCQSFAVAFAADILERKTAHYSEKYIWDMVTYNRLQNPNDEFRPYYDACTKSVAACSGCNIGSNLVKALVSAKSGLPFDFQYNSDNLCGKKKPEFNLTGLRKFQFNVLWWDEDKQENDLNFPPNNYDRKTVLPAIKSQLSNGFPVLVSICSLGFQSYINGVHYENEEECNKLGWHAMTVVGYDNNMKYPGGKGAFKIANSADAPSGSGQPAWGTGYLWISYPAFMELTRLVTFMSVDLSDGSLDWQPPNIKKNTDGSDQALEEESRIGFYQIELNQRANSNIPVCLDANDWFHDGRDPNPVIMYHCQKERLKIANNQKWEIWLKDQIDGNRYYVIRSQSKFFKEKVLAIRDKRLVLEDEIEDFDENQRWLITWSPNKKGRVIVWAGQGAEFTLQADAVRLQSYSDVTAPAPFILQNFSNLASQTWVFKDVTLINEK